MSVNEIENEISKLAPAELKQLANWLAALCPASRNSSRPRVGEITSKRVSYESDCFGPLTEEEMTEWGFA
jgi:hypothetical protein